MFDPQPIVRDDKGRVDVTRLVEKLKELKTQQPDQAAITLQTEDAARFEDVVRLIDTCIKTRDANTEEVNLFPSVSVAPASPG